MKLVGITRLSLVTNKTLGSFRATKGKSLEEAKKIVFLHDKLVKREKLFSNFCLPTYLSLIKEDQDVHAILLINEDLPEPFKEKIKSLVFGKHNIHLIEMGDDADIAPTAKAVINEIAGNEQVFTFRYDDDDCLPVNYASLIKERVPADADQLVVSLNKGYMLSRVSEHEFGINVRKYPLNAFGLGVVSAPNKLKTIFELGAHTKISLDTVHDVDNIGWLSAVHDENDSRIGPMLAPISGPDKILSVTRDIFPQLTQAALYDLPFRRAPDA
ncbi:glycosyltransferase [Leclercia adecarboxylata]|uniref:glycosyltransferase n=1 Tax=Leclercia adecarboxylata TaxID=83655 RepID=UPI002550AB2C|nr:glycosyltransferase [Leclercia adecarboxylata]